jgi:hypothetical protein
MKQVYSKEMKTGRYYLIYGSTPKRNYPWNSKFPHHSKCVTIIKCATRNGVSKILDMEWTRMSDRIRYCPKSDYVLEKYDDHELGNHWHKSRTPTTNNCTRKVIFELDEVEVLLHTNQL